MSMILKELPVQLMKTGPDLMVQMVPEVQGALMALKDLMALKVQVVEVAGDEDVEVEAVALEVIEGVGVVVEEDEEVEEEEEGVADVA